ncbi:SIMPL domain-containing protein [Microbacterium sp. W1N]|uniref:SIMPL domain-containing protein n=1 Tax=Microbacterium festucae TaxID=2977531 RepID=UPI0021BE3A43|nr:SIMPL domain-containing protein [Microbacterium festucae]MCT9820389.1 SIMPL domain-containing protein [Microbacterium festucae]
MSDVVITLRGDHEVRLAPERAVAVVTVAVEGPERGRVVDRLATAAEPLRADLEARRAAGGLAAWHSGRVAVWTERPWNADGRQLDPVHHASVEHTATFTDIPALSAWLDVVAQNGAVQVGRIDWQLTPETRRTLERETAAAAVTAAVERATAYAAAIGHAEVEPIEISDVGLLAPAGAAPLMARAAFAADAAGPAIDLRPDDIVVTASVEARFRAR